MKKYLNLPFQFINLWDIIPLMDQNIDNIDLSILRQLQKDAAQSVDEIADKVSMSRNACWRRIKRMEENGTISARVALVNPDAVGLGQTVLVMIRTNAHDPNWLTRFRDAVRAMPEITSVYRMSGDLDYVLKVQVRDVKAYDSFYQRLIARIPIANVSASFVMEGIKDTTELPL